MKALAIAMAGALVTAALAQEIQVGETVQGELGGTDILDEGGHFQDVYNLTLEAGQGVVLSVQAQNLDTMLRVRRPDATQLEDDDSGGNLNPLLMLTADQAGIYKVTVTTFSPGTTGSYTLAADSGEGRRLTLGEPLAVELSGGPATLQLPVPPNEAVILQVMDSDFDPTLTIMTAQGDRLSADTSAGQQRPRLLIPAGAGGMASIILSTYTEPQGQATLLATNFTPIQTIDYAGGAPGVFSGTLDAGSEGNFVLLRAPANSRLIIDATSHDFVTALQWLNASINGGYNSYGQPFPPSRVRAAAPASGEIYLEVSARHPGESGTYEIVAFDLGPGMLPDFTLSDIDGNRVDSSQFDGRVRIVVLYGTWSADHRDTMAAITDLARQWGDRVAVLAISAGDDPSSLRSLGADLGLPFPQLTDPTGNLGMTLGEETLSGTGIYAPALLVVDAQGRIVREWTNSFPSRDRLDEAVAALLAP